MVKDPDFKITLPLLITKYCSGRFYFLSSKAVQYLITKRENIIKEYLEDYAIGYNLHEYFKSPILKLSTSKTFADIDSNNNSNSLGKMNFV